MQRPDRRVVDADALLAQAARDQPGLRALLDDRLGEVDVGAEVVVVPEQVREDRLDGDAARVAAPSVSISASEASE